MNIHQTPEQRILQLEAENLSLTNSLSDAEAAIEDLKEELASANEQIKDIDDFDDDEIRREFESRGMIDAAEREWRLLAEMIASGEKNRALDLLAELTEGSVSPAIARMQAANHAQGSMF